MSYRSKYTLAIGALLLALCLGSSGGCSVYKIDVPQGNFLDNDDIAKLKVGMTRRQVQFLLGTPMVADVFHPDRWDYVFSYYYGRTGVTVKRSLTVYFDGDTVSRIELPDDFTPPA